MPRRFLAVGLVAAAVGGGAAVWYAAAPDDVAIYRTPGSGWTGYASEEDIQADAFDARRREGLEAILSAMRVNGARPEQIANVERMLDNLEG